MAKQAAARDWLDFSRPRNLSDGVLVVEGYRFHVHRNILMRWSPVFSRMFTAEFREKTAQQIPLPGKKPSEIQEMLLVIYPTSAKQVDEGNFLFLLDLAREYMMTKLTQKCEDYLMYSLEKPCEQSVYYYGPPQYPRQLCLDLLETAQEYKLKNLQTACVEKAQGISFSGLKNHEVYNKISFPNYRKIVEGRIAKMENDLRKMENDLRKSESAFET